MSSEKEDFAIPGLRTPSRLSGEKARVLSDWAWTTLGQLAAATGFLAGIRLLTQYISPAIFGTVSLLTGAAALVSATFFGPFIEAALRFYPDASRNGQAPLLKKIINSFLFMAYGSIVPFLAAAGFFLFTYKKDIGFLIVVMFLCALMVIDTMKAKERNFLNAERKQKKLSAWLATDAWARSLAAVAMVLVFGGSVWAVLAGYFAGSCMVLIHFRENAEYGRNCAFGTQSEKEKDLLTEIRRYALPMVPIAIVGWISSLGDRYIMGAMTGLEQVGIYSAAYGLVSRPFLMAGSVLEQTLRPVYFDAVSSGDKGRERKAFMALLCTTIFFSLCFAAIISIFSREIAGLLLEKKYRASAGLMPWIALGYAFLVTSYVFEKICFAYKRTKAVSLVQTAGALASLCIGIPLIYYYGMRGAAIAVPVYFGIQLALSVIAAKKVLNDAG